MTIKQQILIAVANGAVGIRQVARELQMSHSSIYNHFGDLQSAGLIRWQRGKCNTLRLGPLAVAVKRRGRTVAVGRFDIGFKSNVNQD